MPDNKIEDGDKLSIKLSAENKDKDFILMNYQFSKNTNLRDSKDNTLIADLDMKDRKSINLTFKKIDANFTAEINAPFMIYSENLNNYFENHPDENSTTFYYNILINDKPIEEKIKFNISKPKVESLSERKSKTTGTYEKGESLGEGEFSYNIKVSSLLSTSNEFVIYDTPDINTSFEGKIKIALPTKYGGVDNIILYNKSSKKIDDMKISVKDIYYKVAPPKSSDEPKMAEYESKKIRFDRRNSQTSEDFIDSIEEASVPKNILVEKNMNDPLNPEEQKIIDDNGGLNKEIGKGFKIRITNLKGKNIENKAGNMTIIYYTTIKGNSPKFNSDGMPIYKNTFSLYGQDITDGDCQNGVNCTSPKVEKTLLEDIIKGKYTTSGQVNSGSISADVDKYSNVTFKKVDSENKKGLKGAEFTIYKVDGSNKKEIARNKDNKPMENLITNDKGELCFREENGNLTPANLSLERGSYIFKEIKAPENYKIINEETPLTVGFLKNNLQIENKKEGNNTPTTPTTPTKPGGGTTHIYVNPDPDSPDRIGGNDRIDTAVKVSQNQYSSSKAVILANKDKFSDVLTAVPFSVQIGAPILFTNTDSLPEITKKEVARLGASYVYINGGTNSVSKSIENGLIKSGKTVNRFDGKDRYDTARLIGEKIREKGNKSVVEIASGQTFPDALSISSLAVKENAPILLSKKDDLTIYTKNALAKWNVDKATIAGQTHTISNLIQKEIENGFYLDKKSITDSDGVFNGVKDTKRIGGDDRYATSALIAKYTLPESKIGVYASGQVFADSLVAGPYAASKKSPVLLIKKDSIPSSIADYTKKSKIDKAIVIGGPNTIYQKTLETIGLLIKR